MKQSDGASFFMGYALKPLANNKSELVFLRGSQFAHTSLSFTTWWKILLLLILSIHQLLYDCFTTSSCAIVLQQALVQLFYKVTSPRLLQTNDYLETDLQRQKDYKIPDIFLSLSFIHTRHFQSPRSRIHSSFKLHLFSAFLVTNVNVCSLEDVQHKRLLGS